ncbi:hypothetical protein COLU111180_04665 [Cohnella lubricantis]|uniref:Nucleoside recognition domain-containing protein n=1 Tax=Cohnella lubricantis TaxID=2163172 RepID=A0A841TAX1_9BACL|nr:hypothetical protein [Cohnella lubricantis]MBB6677175.1 hypothetical protein [Cohnella lubricantis]MBP2117014.1 sporulation integral membrane protein YlbJ [Cohnella lubricantis]
MSDAPPRARPAKWQRSLSIVSGACALMLVIGIVQSPDEAFRASLAGLQIWWQTIFPGMLPPLMLAELLAASGLLHGLGALCEPAVRRLFKLPGSAGWAIVFGWTAGLPAGAKEASRLRDKGLVRDPDMDTLLLVSHLPNPFLIVIIVGSGFLHSPAYGWAIVLGLWLSAIAAGFLWARIAKPSAPAVPPSLAAGEPRALFARVARIIREAREEDGRPFGKQIADAVSHAVALLLAVGGLIIMSSLLLRMLQLAWPEADAWLAIPGLYELHLGAYETSRSPLFDASPVHAVSLLAAVLAWTGWSGLLQARAALGASAAFPWARFIASKLLHAALALAFTFPLAYAAREGSLSRFAPSLSVFAAGPDSSGWGGALPSGLRIFSEMTLVSLASIAVFLLLALIAALIRPSKRPPGPGNKRRR